MPIRRRDALKLLSAGAGAGLLGSLPLPGASKDPDRIMDIELLGFQLAIHIPGTAAVIEGLPAMGGYGAPKVARIDQIRTSVSNLVAGSTEMVETGPTGILGATEQGGDLKILGYFYRNTSLIFVVNSDRIKDYKDLEKPENVVAVNGKGDITHVMLLGPLIKRGVDVNKLTIVEIGGSGGRLRALLSGRVQAVPIHFDQAADVLKQGPYKVLFQPWDFYRLWVNEVWACSGAWLKKPGNGRAAIDVLKATTAAFRRANRDYNWYAQMYRKYATVPKANETTDEVLKPLWHKLVNDVRAWPDYNILTANDMRDLLPLYKAVGDIKGTVNAKDVIDHSYAEQAMKELRKQGL
ncbi:MAG: ABC transporter substrate-binding protein [Candidatus Eremiobacteraeota bacterium]|nr:ABC transporter substrate-binding protein [Candidatus Eremiobacteraeota bacterium]